MKALFKVCAAAALVFGLTAVSAQAQTVRFSVSAEPYPPFASKNAAGKWEGFEVDLIHAICDEMKAKCEVKETAWDGIIPALTSKKIDVIFASMSITDERKKTIDFSIPYYNTPAAVMAAKSTKVDASEASLAGKTIGVQTSTIHSAYAEKFLKDKATIKTYNTQDEANADLAAGRIDATIADSAALEPFVATDAGKDLELKGFFPKDPAIWGAGVGAGIRKGDTKLKAQIDDAIRAIYKNGTYQKIADKYFKYDVGTPPKS
jgi:polar amino acid transport system substrate-binding protein